MPFKKLTQPRSKCFKATTRISQVFPSLGWSFVLKRKQLLWAFFAFFTKTRAPGGWGSANSSGPRLSRADSSLPSLWQHLEREGPEPEYLGPSAGTLGCARSAGPNAAARRPRPRRHKGSLSRKAPRSPGVPRLRRSEDQVSGS